MGEKVRLYFCIFVVLYISHQTQLVEAGTLYIYIFFWRLYWRNTVYKKCI